MIWDRRRAAMRNKMLLGVAGATLSMMPTAALAQGAAVQASAENSADEGEVVVTGYRGSIDRSLRDKRNANAIVEVITAEDISKFPDKNVADALQRVPGVIISRDGGEGKSVSVRGLAADLTLTQLNGNYIASSETNNQATRSFNYLLLPSNMLGKAELFKSSEARLDEGGIGGTVILHTRRPLDLPAFSGFVSAEGTYADTTKKVDPQVSGQLSWKNPDETIGFLVGTTWQRRTNRSMEASTESWQWYDDNPARSGVDVNGTTLNPAPDEWWGQSGFNDQNGRHYSGFLMPTAVDFGIRNEKRERLGIQATAQVRPTDNLTLTANYFRFQLRGDYTLNMLKIPEWNIARFAGDGNWAGGRLLNGLSFDPSKTIVTGAEFELKQGKSYYCSEAAAAAAGKQPGGWGPDDCTVPTPQLTGVYSREKTLSQTADFGVDWNVGDYLVTAKAGRTWSNGGPSQLFNMAAKPRRFVNGTYQAGNRFSSWDLSGTPTMTFSSNLQDQLMAGIAEIDTGSTDSSWNETSIKQNYAQIDVTQTVGNNWLDTLQAGFKYRDGKVSRNTGKTLWYCTGTTTRYQTGCDAQAGVAQPSFFLSEPIGNIQGGFAANVFPGIDFPAYLSYIDNRYGGSVRFEEPDFIYRVNENVLAGYVQANFKTERLRGNLGLRVVQTKQHAESTDSVETYQDYFVDGPDGRPLPCTTEPNCEAGFVKNDIRTKTFTLVKADETYVDVLPSFNFAYDLTGKLLLRGAVAKVIARPSFTDIAFPGALDLITAEYASDRQVAGGSRNPGYYGRGSNKGIKPFEATQFDLGLEWYFHRGSVLGVGLFRKNVKNFVVPVTQNVTVDIAGQPVVIQNFQTSANGRNGVSQGVEVYAQHTFDFGLGFQANYTINDTNLASVTLNGVDIGKSPLVGSAKNQLNLTAFYESKLFLLRASYNRRGEVVGGLHSGLTICAEPYEQIDLNAAINITPQIAITASVLNLTKSEQRSHLGDDTKARFWTNNYSGRIAYAGATFKF